MSRQYNYPLKIIRSQRKTTQIQVVDNQVLVRTNKSSSLKEIEELLDAYQDWIDKKLQENRKRKKVFKLLGRNYELVIIEADEVGYRLTQDTLYCRITKPEDLNWIYDQIYCEHQDLLKQLIMECLDDFPQAPKKVRIKALKRSFGICRSNKTISISLYVLKYSQEFIRMIIYHELCHLKIMNHSAQFYQLLSQYVPDYQKLRKEAKKT